VYKILMTAAIALAAQSAGADGHAQGDPAKGERLFRQCSACHIVEGDRRSAGPTLEGIVGREAGIIEGFRYSDALANSGLTWDAETLRAFFIAPNEVVPGNAMSFRGVRRDTDADDLVAYLESLGASASE